MSALTAVWICPTVALSRCRCEDTTCSFSSEKCTVWKGKTTVCLHTALPATHQHRSEKRTTGSRSSVCTKPYRKPVLHILTKARHFFRGRATHQVATGLDDGAQDGAGVTVIYNSVNKHYLPGLTEYDHSPFLVSYRVQYLKGYLYHSNILI